MKILFFFLGLSFSSMLVLAQPIDTLMYKNFDDGLLTYESPKNRATFFTLFPPFSDDFKASLGALSINGTPNMSVDLGSFRTKLALALNYPKPPYILQASISDVSKYDTLIVQYKIMAAKIDLSNYELQLPDTRPSANVIATYYNSATSKYFSKQYTVQYMGNVQLSFLGNAISSYKYMSGSESKVSVAHKFINEGSSNFLFKLVQRELPNTLQVFDNGSNFNTSTSESLLRQTIQTHFCVTTDNPSGCLAQTPIFNVVANEDNTLSKTFLLDDFLVVGKKAAITTSLSEPFDYSLSKQIHKMYTLQGQEIANISSYKGFAIVCYSDGTRSKQFVE